MKNPESILQDAQSAKPRESLELYKDAITVLREKGYTWREVAEFLNERGVETDHTKVYRFMQRPEALEEPSGFEVPSAERYAEALAGLDLNEAQQQMLEAHFNAHNRAITYTQLARAAGSPSHRTANSQYGKLGRALGEAMGMRFYQSSPAHSPFYSSSLGMGNPYRTDDQHFQLVMHHELAKAIESLGWFRD